MKKEGNNARRPTTRAIPFKNDSLVVNSQAIYVAPNSQSLVNLAPLCARVARAVEDGGLNASAVALARAPPSQQTRLLRVPSFSTASIKTEQATRCRAIEFGRGEGYTTNRLA